MRHLEPVRDRPDHLHIGPNPGAGPPLSIVIPVYREAETLVPTIEAIQAAVALPHELLIVYDDEDDPTVPVARRLARRWPHLRPTLNDLGRGVLNAIKVGFREAKGEAVLVTMADASDDPATIPAMCEKLAEGYDLVSASRYMRGGRQIGGPIVKSILSRLAGVSLHWLAGIPTHDATNSFKLYRRTLLQEIAIESTGGFEVGLELTVKGHLRGYRIAELPTMWRDRREGASNFKTVRWLPHYLKWYWLGIRGGGTRGRHDSLSRNR